MRLDLPGTCAGNRCSKGWISRSHRAVRPSFYVGLCQATERHHYNEACAEGHRNARRCRNCCRTRSGRHCSFKSWRPGGGHAATHHRVPARGRGSGKGKIRCWWMAASGAGPTFSKLWPWERPRFGVGRPQPGAWRPSASGVEAVLVILRQELEKLSAGRNAIDPQHHPGIRGSLISEGSGITMKHVALSSLCNSA